MIQMPVHIEIRKPQVFKRHYEFWQKEQQVAVLDYEKLWGSEAVFRIGDHHWKLKAAGFWKRTIQLRAEQSPYLKLSIPCTWSFKISVNLDNRHTWHFKGTGFWKRTWGWYDERENKVIEFKSNQFSKNNRGQVILHQPVTNEMLLLTALGWYMVIAYEETAAASAAA